MSHQNPWEPQTAQAPPPIPQQYGYAQQSTQPRTETTAILGLVFAFLAWPVGLVLSIIGLRRVKRNGTQGRGLALAGLIISIVAAAFVTVLITFTLVMASQAEETGRSWQEEVALRDAAAGSSTTEEGSEPLLDLGADPVPDNPTLADGVTLDSETWTFSEITGERSPAMGWTQYSTTVTNNSDQEQFIYVTLTVSGPDGSTTEVAGSVAEPVPAGATVDILFLPTEIEGGVITDVVVDTF